MLRRLGSLALASLLAVSSAALNSGCGTILGYAGPQPIKVHLNPDEKGTVYLDQVKVGEGSGTYMVNPKAEGHAFNVKTADGRTGNGGVTRELMPMVVVCDAFMLLFPILIDYFDGGMYSWRSDLPINLGKAPEVQPQPTDTIKPLNTGGSSGTNANTSGQAMVPCPTCGEMRPVNSETCPHCGMK